MTGLEPAPIRLFRTALPLSYILLWSYTHKTNNHSDRNLECFKQNYLGVTIFLKLVASFLNITMEQEGRKIIKNYLLFHNTIVPLSL